MFTVLFRDTDGLNLDTGFKAYIYHDDNLMVPDVGLAIDCYDPLGNNEESIFFPMSVAEANDLIAYIFSHDKIDLSHRECFFWNSATGCYDAK